MNVKAVLNNLHIERLNDMQKNVYECAHNTSKDIVVLSPTGTGKTLAYMLPLMELINGNDNHIQAIVVVPGRELALQSNNVLKEMRSEIRSLCCYGGRAAMDEHKALKKTCPHIVFGTPGRLNDHLDKENILSSNVRYLVIDEFDKCLQMGFFDEMSELINKLPNIKRTILLSATDTEQIPGFIDLKNAERLDYLDSVHSISNRIRQYKIYSNTRDKLDTLNALLCSFGNNSSIVFLNYRDSVERTANYLKEKGFSVSYYHGGLDQKSREIALYKFRNGSTNVLVSTDLASRGLDIPEVDNIIHYHMPLTSEDYTHRVGRTARWYGQGSTYFLLAPDEDMPGFIDTDVADIELPPTIKHPELSKMITLYIGKGKKDKLSKGDIVGFLCKIGGLNSQEIGLIDVMERYTYVAIPRNKAKQVLQQTSGEKIKGIRTIVELIK